MEKGWLEAVAKAADCFPLGCNPLAFCEEKEMKPWRKEVAVLFHRQKKELNVC